MCLSKVVKGTRSFFLYHIQSKAHTFLIKGSSDSPLVTVSCPTNPTKTRGFVRQYAKRISLVLGVGCEAKVASTTIKPVPILVIHLRPPRGLEDKPMEPDLRAPPSPRYYPPRIPCVFVLDHLPPRWGYSWIVHVIHQGHKPPSKWYFLQRESPTESSFCWSWSTVPLSIWIFSSRSASCFS
jgi:hypothetical protein